MLISKLGDGVKSVEFSEKREDASAATDGVTAIT